MANIFTGDIDGKSAVCFDTGLDPRSFARTKMSQSLIECGYIAYPDGRKEVWKPLGVNEVDGSMRVWGAPFSGERLDLILKKAGSSSSGGDSDSLMHSAFQKRAARQTALQYIIYWIRAKLLLGETNSAISPGAAFVSPQGNVFFAPEHLALRCLFVEGAEPNYFYCPDLQGIDAAAFCAGAMLYLILANDHPYPQAASVYQDMREGVFLAPHLAAAGLNDELARLINSALLLPAEKKQTGISGTEILSGLLNLLMDKDSNIVPISSLFRSLSAEETSKLEKDISFFYRGKSSVVKARRFVARNKPALLLASIAAFIVLVLGLSLIRSRSDRMTTEGMEARTVVITYYEAFNSLNHMMMEACVNGASRADIDVAVNFFVLDRVRQAHEFGAPTSITSARIWQQMGNELPAENVFGITDLEVTHLGGGEAEGIMIFRADYMIWFPYDFQYSIRSDQLTLMRDRRRNWRITEIHRTERW